MSARNNSIYAVLAVAVALLAGPSSASAQWVSSAPTINGAAHIGKTLTAVGGNAGGPSGTVVGYIWLRCDGNTTYSRGCELLRANESTYPLTNSDRNRYIRVARVALMWWELWTVRSLFDVEHRVSNPTARVATAPAPTPTPTPTPRPPAPTPTPRPPAPAPTPAKPPVGTPTPTVTAPIGGDVAPPPAPPAPGEGEPPTFEVTPAPQPAPPASAAPPTGGVLGAKGKAAKMLKPFPIVRISGRLTTGGANIRVLSVKAPKGAKITVKCSGKGCPRKSVARATKVLRISQFQRVLPAGIKLRISISKKGYISKVTTIRIRKGKAPLRSDQCQMPGAKKLIRCPK